ncbi:MAG: hypothetical protein QXP34_00080 [Candidatus Aenigmatarchaeota archaeon]
MWGREDWSVIYNPIDSIELNNIKPEIIFPYKLILNRPQPKDAKIATEDLEEDLYEEEYIIMDLIEDDHGKKYVIVDYPPVFNSILKEVFGGSKIVDLNPPKKEKDEENDEFYSILKFAIPFSNHRYMIYLNYIPLDFVVINEYKTDEGKAKVEYDENFLYMVLAGIFSEFSFFALSSELLYSILYSNANKLGIRVYSLREIIEEMLNSENRSIKYYI